MKKKTRNKFDILREIREIDEVLDRSEDEASEIAPMQNPTTLIMKKAQLRHELKMIEAEPSDEAAKKRIQKQLKIMRESQADAKVKAAEELSEEELERILKAKREAKSN